jgi:rhomboid protease GluP
VIENALDRVAADLRSGAFSTLDLEIARGLVSPRDHELTPMSPTRGVVTSALTVAIILCFAVEVAISRDSFQGEGAAASVAYRMGAIHQASIQEGQWSRLIAAPFLHFGLLHLAMNGWAQWSLGGPLEFLMGSWRFLALWLGSALGASLTSFVFNDTSISAGASGAIFGLLGAFTIFVFFRKDVLPQPVPRSLRNGVLATLLLNLMISFVPGIDMAAHGGGFMTGALLGFGLAKRGRAARSAPPRSRGLRLAVALLVVVGVGVSSVQQRADLSVAVPEIATEYRVGEVSLPVPVAFSVSETRARGLTVVEADGDPASPFSVTFKLSEPQVDEAAARRMVQTLRSEAGPTGTGPARETGWIAISQLGLQDRRAIEVVVVAPTSCQRDAERLLTDLAKGIR